MSNNTTALSELIKWIDDEIVLNPYYRASPRLTEGAMIAKGKATEFQQPDLTMLHLLMIIT